MKAPRVQWRSAVSYILALHALGLGSLAALIAIVTIEFTWPTARHFLGGYPATFWVITNLLNLGFTFSVVNRVVQRRDALRWNDVMSATLKGLNDEVRTTRDILWVALFGQPPFGANKQVEAAYATAQHSGLEWPGSPFGDASGQIEAMEGNLVWTQTAAKILRMATEQIREGLVRWAPMMTLAHGDSKVLVPVTRLADVLEVMEFPFADNRTDNGQSCVEDKFRGALRELWLHALTTCVYAEESVVRALYPKREWPERGDAPWTSEKPRKFMLSDSQRNELDEWLAHPLRFESATRARQQEVTRHLEWPW